VIVGSSWSLGRAAVGLALLGTLSLAPTSSSRSSGWQVFTPRTPKGSVLIGVSCVSRTSCTAVGRTGTSTALIETWNGRAWSVSPSAKLRAGTSYFNSVDCVSARSCWAIGVARNNLFEHWNGRSWQVLSAPPGAYGPTGLSCPSLERCVAVGFTDSTAEFAMWNGARWTVSHAAASIDQPNGVSCVSPRFCEAVGEILLGTGRLHPLGETWNGAQWSSSSAIDARGGKFNDVSCWSSTGCMAVGSWLSGSPLRSAGLAETWNGRRWAVVTVPAVGGPEVVLNGVACASSRDCIAVAWPFANRQPQPVVLSWNGTRFKEIATPRVAGGGMLESVALRDGMVVTVGQVVQVVSRRETGPGGALIEVRK
jgi:hypothetical protein